MGENATETLVKAEILERYRVIHFATHGLLAEETQRVRNSLGEPALILPPPAAATQADDGLLTATEIAQLRLNADWVVLSACNTAAARPDSTDPLSGMARAFFYAGARSLLVSHWAVDSDAAVLIMTRTFAELKQSPSMGRAEAFRRAMMSLIENKSQPEGAHPSVWAPFVLVGDGGN